MKVLYAIQGTGNGHLSRARDIVPELMKRVEVDILVSGIQADVALPYPVKYKFHGLSFIFGKKGGIDFMNTYFKNNTRRFYHEIKQLPIDNYDLILNDFEPVSAWACKLKNKPCVSLSHQAAVLSAYAPQPDHSDKMGEFILKKYAPVSSRYGFHFRNYEKNIFTPVIRKQVREEEIRDLGHYTVYLPAYDEERLVKVLSKIPEVRWEVFSKHSTEAKQVKNLFIKPIRNDDFIRSMATSSGILCGAGFETPAEALYMGKKLMVIPMKNQYEQHFNAAALKQMGVPVVKSLKKKHLDKFEAWVNSNESVQVNYPDITDKIIDQVLEEALEVNFLKTY